MFGSLAIVKYPCYYCNGNFRDAAGQRPGRPGNQGKDRWR